MATSLRVAGPVARAQRCCWVGWHLRQGAYSEHTPTRSWCRAVAPESGAEWLASPNSGGSAGGARPLSLLDDDLGQASQEFQELCRLQLELLTAALQLSLQAVLTSSIAGSVSESLDEECLRQQLLLETACLHSSVYCRAPGSLQTGQLQLQLVAASAAACSPGGGVSGGGSTGGGGFGGGAAQRFLLLGQDGPGGAGMAADQERRILEQSVIVLPDSGGLVLPLAHNGFLVGLLVVERCLEEGLPGEMASPREGEAGGSPGTAAAASGSISAASSSNGGASAAPPPPPRMPQAPACLLFRSAELQLLKQTAGVLSLACAMDLRAALERAGAAYRQRQASALVQAAKQPLSVMRTLGTMLLPRLQPGEPDRDFAQGILEQGSRLQEVVSQLQAALHPAAVAAAVPPALQPGSNTWQGQQGPQGLLPAPPGGRTLAEQARPALPSSSIGSDFQWGPGSTIDIEEGQGVSAVGPSGQPWEAGSGSSGSSNGGGSGSQHSGPSSGSIAAVGASSSSSGGGFGSRASADLLNVLMPLLASASNFAAVSGISFVMADHCSSGSGGGSASSTGSGGGSSSSSNGSALGSGGSVDGLQAAPAVAVQHQVSLPAAEVAVGPGKLKRMLSQLIDGIIACAARGDLVQASVLPQHWQGRPGVAVTLCCCYSLTHGAPAGSGSGGGGGAAGHLPRPPLQPEFAFLQGSASEAGGWFEVHAEPTPDVRHLNSSALAATLWLPTVVRDAGWP